MRCLRFLPTAKRDVKRIQLVNVKKKLRHLLKGTGKKKSSLRVGGGGGKHFGGH